MKRIGVMFLALCLSGYAIAAQENAPRLALVKIVQDPFMLVFDGKNDIPIGTNIHGFVVTQFTPKFEKRTLADGKEHAVDVSELTLKRGDKTITLVKGQRISYNEHIVRIVDQANRKEYEVRTGQVVTIGSRSLRLRDVNTMELTCTLEDVKSGEQLTIKWMAQPPSAGDVLKAAPEK